MTFLTSIPLWGYFIVLGAAFLTGHLLGLRPEADMRPGRRMAGRWGSSLLLLIALLVISNKNVGTVLPAVLLAFVGGLVSGRTAPPASSARPASGQESDGPQRSGGDVGPEQDAQPPRRNGDTD